MAHRLRKVPAVVVEYCNNHIFIYHDGMPASETAERRYAFKTDFFKALAHPLRIQLLEILVQGERSVQELQQALGLDQPVVSQQLAVLRARHIVEARKDGTTVRYAVRDPLIGQLLEVARRIFDNQLAGTQAMLRDLRRETRRR
jgi:DNA-binding transcriptional ArsR family regulator